MSRQEYPMPVRSINLLTAEVVRAECEKFPKQSGKDGLKGSLKLNRLYRVIGGRVLSFDIISTPKKMKQVSPSYMRKIYQTSEIK